ncbi:MAG: hypothetical protein WBE26_13510 [Phycisphaerae bacterium]
MFKRLLIVGFGALSVTSLVGCDEETLAKVAPDAAKMFTASQGVQAGDLLMDQFQTQDRLRDGTGLNCTNPGDPGTCDGSGPYGTGGYGDNGGGQGTGSGGGDRLRDGSCGG